MTVAVKLDFSTRDWYTGWSRRSSKPLKTLRFGEGSENPSLEALIAALKF
jgi:hypothetical protein